MTLKEWMEERDISVAQLAARLGRQPETVRRYIAGERIPDRSTMPLIATETDGAVTANDFFGIAA